LRKAGILVGLQEQSLKVLVELLERPGELVTREQLRQRLWPDGTFVDFDLSGSKARRVSRSGTGLGLFSRQAVLPSKDGEAQVRVRP
jgi:hypothetical protein